MKKYATMTGSGASVVTAKSKKEAAEKLNTNIENVYRYENI